MKNFKVLFIPSWYPTKQFPESGIFFKNQANALRNRGFDVNVITPPIINNLLSKSGVHKIYKIFNSPKISSTNKDGLTEYRSESFGFTRYYWLRNFFLFRNSNLLLRRYMKEKGKPDIIHAHSVFFGGFLAYYFKRKYKIPYIITEVSTAAARNKIPLSEYSFFKKVFKNAHKRIMISPQLGNLLENKFGGSIKPWQCIPLMVTDNFFKTNQENIVNNITNGEFLFLNIGIMHLHDQKGHKDLLNAFANNFRNQKNVQLELIGDGPNRKNLEVLVKQLGIWEQIRFKGQMKNEEIPQEINKCNVLVVSSHYETFGVAVIEAMAYGKPVVATECGGPESIVNKDNGIIVPRMNVQKLGEGLNNIKNNIKNYDPNIIAEYCKNNYSEKVIVQKLIDLYLEVLN